MPTLEIIYHDDINNLDLVAKITRVDSGVPQVQVNDESIELYLQNLIDQAPYVNAEDDLTVLRAIAAHLANGVNRYSVKSPRIIPH